MMRTRNPTYESPLTMTTMAASLATFSTHDPASPLSVSPARTALLLIDYQNLVVSRLGEAGPRVLNIAAQMRQWALEKGILLFHCLVDTSAGARPPPLNKTALSWKYVEEQVSNSPWMGGEADAVAAPGGSKTELTVTRAPGVMSALEPDQALQVKLRQCGVTSLLVCGVATSGCVLSTVRAATDLGYIVTVVEDACFDPKPGLHGVLCAHVLSATAHVATSWEIRDAWRVL